MSLRQQTARESDSPFCLTQPDIYARWRKEKLARYIWDISDLVVEVGDLTHPTDREIDALSRRIKRANMVIYQCRQGDFVAKSPVIALSRGFGLVNLDHNNCAEEDGITHLSCDRDGHREFYIPYTDRAINWHTDGYYNDLDRQIHGLALHCVRPAVSGGESSLVDHELVYLRMRDENPDWIAALMVDDVMTIPANPADAQSSGEPRSGPVFSVHPESGSLHMRYTARKRNIDWKSDPLIDEARAYLDYLLNDLCFGVHRATLQPGQGLICANVLHGRTAFEDGPSEAQSRLIYRARFFDSITFE